MTTNTDYSKKCEILNDLWINHINNEMFEDFIEVNDLGLPMAHFISQGIVESTTLAQELVEQSFEDLLELLEIKDVGFTNLKQMV
jgi:uncharacterized protein (DUF2164 family)